jgi:hypothetical protein
MILPATTLGAGISAAGTTTAAMILPATTLGAGISAAGTTTAAMILPAATLGAGISAAAATGMVIGSAHRRPDGRHQGQNPGQHADLR